MKVLIISSSPRKEGNSDVLCERFAKGAAESRKCYEVCRKFGKPLVSRGS